MPLEVYNHLHRRYFSSLHIQTNLHGYLLAAETTYQSPWLKLSPKSQSDPEFEIETWYFQASPTRFIFPGVISFWGLEELFYDKHQRADSKK
ncbi:hypothetical protein DSO57_1032110 [Entomophthora muscae]|uniref:Uncharacterized protein n=1 Tax=Entomophthora muscae TaxID=34485 RepID=A0ACC2TZ34_9FUNG|nr:hypothetical protein DSO57_1032110 [Entomophthora muscae]